MYHTGILGVDKRDLTNFSCISKHVRQQVLRKTFSNVEDYAKCPGRIFEPSDIQIGSYPKLSMTLAERDKVKFGPGTGPDDDPNKMRSRSGNRYFLTSSPSCNKSLTDAYMLFEQRTVRSRYGFF